MIAAGPAHTFLAHCHSPQLLTSRKPNNDEAHNRAKAGVQAAEANPWRCSTASARGWWKHVSRRLRLHSRTSLRVICQYGAPHARAYWGLVILPRIASAHGACWYFASRRGSPPPPPLHPRNCPAALTATLRSVAMHAHLLLVRPLAQARHVDGAPRHAAPCVQSGPPREKPLLLSTARSTWWAARAGRAGVGS
jgi:hypothetical protein